jgi:hypothetical protein
MGTPQVFNQIINDQLYVNAAWLPITNAFRLGDYGVVSDGIFTAIGNVGRDFGLKPQASPGARSTVNFTTRGTNIARVAADATVNVFPESDVDAKLVIQFKSESSFLLKADVTASQMQNINQIAYGIYHNKDWEHWRYKYRVVTGTYVATNCAIISSIAKDSSIELSGKANALKQFDIGNATAGIGVTNRKEIGLELLGKSGVIALSFFKLTWWSGADPKTLAGAEVLPPQMFADAKALAKDDL